MGVSQWSAVSPLLLVLLSSSVLQLAYSAPLSWNDTSSVGCFHMMQSYSEGDQIISNEPCLNCSCSNNMLMCFLKVCPYVRPLSKGCTVSKLPGDCCPTVTCQDVPVPIITMSMMGGVGGTGGSGLPLAVGSTEETVTVLPDSVSDGQPGCQVDGDYYRDGAQVPRNPLEPCDVCYCIRNHTACVQQECTMSVPGCRPVFQPGVCCPVRYDCAGQMTTTSTTTTTPEPQLSVANCQINGTTYSDGEAVASDDTCEHCYCMKGELACAIESCPSPLDSLHPNCRPVPPKPGQCCPQHYDCQNNSTLESSVQLGGPATALGLGGTTPETDAPTLETTEHTATDESHTEEIISPESSASGLGASGQASTSSEEVEAHTEDGGTHQGGTAAVSPGVDQITVDENQDDISESTTPSYSENTAGVTSSGAVEELVTDSTEIEPQAQFPTTTSAVETSESDMLLSTQTHGETGTAQTSEAAVTTSEHTPASTVAPPEEMVTASHLAVTSEEEQHMSVTEAGAQSTNAAAATSQASSVTIGDSEEDTLSGGDIDSVDMTAGSGESSGDSVSIEDTVSAQIISEEILSSEASLLIDESSITTDTSGDYEEDHGEIGVGTEESSGSETPDSISENIFSESTTLSSTTTSALVDEASHSTPVTLISGPTPHSHQTTTTTTTDDLSYLPAGGSSTTLSGSTDNSVLPVEENYEELSGEGSGVESVTHEQSEIDQSTDAAFSMSPDTAPVTTESPENLDHAEVASTTAKPSQEKPLLSIDEIESIINGSDIAETNQDGGTFDNSEEHSGDIVDIANESNDNLVEELSGESSGSSPYEETMSAVDFDGVATESTGVTDKPTTTPIPAFTETYETTEQEIIQPSTDSDLAIDETSAISESLATEDSSQSFVAGTSDKTPTDVASITESVEPTTVSTTEHSVHSSTEPVQSNTEGSSQTEYETSGELIEELSGSDEDNLTDSQEIETEHDTAELTGIASGASEVIDQSFGAESEFSGDAEDISSGSLPSEEDSIISTTTNQYEQAATSSTNQEFNTEFLSLTTQASSVSGETLISSTEVSESSVTDSSAAVSAEGSGQIEPESTASPLVEQDISVEQEEVSPLDSDNDSAEISGDIEIVSEEATSGHTTPVDLFDNQESSIKPEVSTEHSLGTDHVASSEGVEESVIAEVDAEESSGEEVNEIGISSEFDGISVSGDSSESEDSFNNLEEISGDVFVSESSTTLPDQSVTDVDLSGDIVHETVEEASAQTSEDMLVVTSAEPTELKPSAGVDSGTEGGTSSTDNGSLEPEYSGDGELSTEQHEMTTPLEPLEATTDQVSTEHSGTASEHSDSGKDNPVSTVSNHTVAAIVDAIGSVFEAVANVTHTTEHSTSSAPEEEEPTAASSTESPAGATCQVDGRVYRSSVAVPSGDPCQPECRCMDGEVVCQTVDCAAAPVQQNCRPVYSNGSCCPEYSCEQESVAQCALGGSLYSNGEIVPHRDPCSYCLCINGEIICASQMCKTPQQLQGLDCQPLTSEQCCSTRYQCDADALETLDFGKDNRTEGGVLLLPSVDSSVAISVVPVQPAPEATDRPGQTGGDTEDASSEHYSTTGATATEVSETVTPAGTASSTISSLLSSLVGNGSESGAQAATSGPHAVTDHTSTEAESDLSPSVSSASDNSSQTTITSVRHRLNTAVYGTVFETVTVVTVITETFDGQGSPVITVRSTSRKSSRPAVEDDKLAAIAAARVTSLLVQTYIDNEGNQQRLSSQLEGVPPRWSYLVNDEGVPVEGDNVGDTFAPGNTVVETIVTKTVSTLRNESLSAGGHPWGVVHTITVTNYTTSVTNSAGETVVTRRQTVGTTKRPAQLHEVELFLVQQAPNISTVVIRTQVSEDGSRVTTVSKGSPIQRPGVEALMIGNVHGQTESETSTSSFTNESGSSAETISSTESQTGSNSESTTTIETQTTSSSGIESTSTGDAESTSSSGVESTSSAGVESTSSGGVESTSSGGVESTSSAGVESTSSAGVESTSSAGVESTSSAGVESTSSAGVESTSSAGVESTSSAGIESTSSSGVESTSSSGVESSSASVESTSLAGVDSTSSAGVESTSSAGIESTSSAGVESTSSAGIESTSSSGVESTSSSGVESTSSAGVDSTSSAGVESTSSAGVESTSSAGVESTSLAGVESTSSAGVESTSLAGVEPGSSEIAGSEEYSTVSPGGTSQVISVTDDVLEMLANGFNSTELSETSESDAAIAGSGEQQEATETDGEDATSSSSFPSSLSNSSTTTTTTSEISQHVFLGPGACLFDGRVYVSAQQIPRENPCDFCFCFRGDIICLQQSCPQPSPACPSDQLPFSATASSSVNGSCCVAQSVEGFCCPRYVCTKESATVAVRTATAHQQSLDDQFYQQQQLAQHLLQDNPHRPLVADPTELTDYASITGGTIDGCDIQGHHYLPGQIVSPASGPCLECRCGSDGMMACNPQKCQPQPLLKNMMIAAAHRRRR